MNRYTLLHLGAPRTGTTALWNFFRKHNEITVSNEKEPIWNWDKRPETYLESFQIKDRTKVLVDCTPIIVLLHKNRQYFRDIDAVVDRRCCLYTMRSDTMRRVKSYLEVLLADYYLRNKNSILIRNGKISLECLDFIVTEYVNDFKLIQMIQDFFGEDNVFVVHLKEFNKKKNDLFRFLDVLPNDITLEHEKNPILFENTVRYVNYLKSLSLIKEYLANKETELKKIIKISKEAMLKKYGIE